MSKVQEIEAALHQLPVKDQWAIAFRLLDDLDGRSMGEPGDAGSKEWAIGPALPDYSARRRRIFGEKSLPNVVLDSRAEERW